MKTILSPKISVVMSVHNGMPYIKDSVESILGQSYKNFELIIVDDFSTDHSCEYLTSLRDKRIKLIKNNKNLGLSASLNKAIKISRGSYIARMDADDISDPQRLSEQISFMTRHTSINLCGTWAILIDENGKKVGKLKYPTDSNEIQKKIVLFNPIVHPSLMAKKSFFDQLGGYSEEYDGAEDYELLMRGSKFFKYANLPKELLLLRLSSTRRSAKSMKLMDKLDLKIKINSLKTRGASPLTIYAIFKKIIFIYLIPSPIKLRIAKVLKKI